MGHGNTGSNNDICPVHLYVFNHCFYVFFFCHSLFNEQSSCLPHCIVTINSFVVGFYKVFGKNFFQHWAIPFFQCFCRGKTEKLSKIRFNVVLFCCTYRDVILNNAYDFIRGDRPFMVLYIVGNCLLIRRIKLRCDLNNPDRFVRKGKRAYNKIDLILFQPFLRFGCTKSCDNLHLKEGLKSSGDYFRSRYTCMTYNNYARLQSDIFFGSFQRCSKK